MYINEYNNYILRTIDCESRAIIISDDKKNYRNLIDFGNCCINLTDENGDLYVSRWESPEYQAISISEDDFWKICGITDYICNYITNGVKGGITEAFGFWDDWNNSFQVIEVNNMYYGIYWWTTA